MGQTVVVQGLGLLGLYGAAIAKARGARTVIGLDTMVGRRDRAHRFGVDLALDPATTDRDDLLRRVRQLCRPEGADVVLEVCGVPEVIPLGIEMLRVGGTYVLGGVVNPKAMVTIDANQVLRKLLTLRGVHNYHPRNLIEALDFVVGQPQALSVPRPGRREVPARPGRRRDGRRRCRARPARGHRSLSLRGLRAGKTTLRPLGFFACATRIQAPPAFS